MALLGMIAALGDLRPHWQFQVVLPGHGPLYHRVRQTRATPSVVSMPTALARMGEWAAVQDGWSPRSQVALGLNLCGTAASLPRYESRLERVVSEFGPDLIHTNGLKAHVLGARVRSSQTRLAWHLHEYISRRTLTRWLLRRYGSRPSAIIANSASVASDVKSVVGRTREIHVVPNSVNLDVFTAVGARLDLDGLAGLPPVTGEIIRVGLVATYGRWKGHSVFLDAIQSIASERPIRGYIIGGPIYDTTDSQFTRRELQTMIDSRQLGGRVGLTGFVEPAPAMRALDIVVHASTEPEPFGLVIAEAMACGKAVITTGEGGAAELITPGYDALVAPARDPRALAAAIGKLAIDSAERYAIGEHASQTARIRFAPEIVGSQVARIFESIAVPSGVAQSA